MGVGLKLRLGADIAAAAVAGRRKPLFVAWSLTDVCNLSCDYCGRWDRGSPELPDRRILELPAEMASAGVARVALTGGEPLVHRMCVPLARALHDEGLQVALNSNGALLPRHLAEIGESVGSATISLDGGRAVHDAQRGRGAWDKAMAGARAVREAGIDLALHCVVTSRNVEELDGALDAARSLDVEIAFAPLEEVPAMRRRELEGLWPRPTAWRAAVDRLLARKRSGAPVRNSEAGLRYLRNWPVYAPIACSAGLVYARIEPDGRLYGCGNLVWGEGPSLLSTSFGEAFAALGRDRCWSCWCDTRVEMNLVLEGNPSAIRAAAGARRSA